MPGAVDQRRGARRRRLGASATRTTAAASANQNGPQRARRRGSSGIELVAIMLLGIHSTADARTDPNPSRVEAAGTKPKLIDEYVGRVNTRRGARERRPHALARGLGGARPAPGLRRVHGRAGGLPARRARGRRARRARRPGGARARRASGCATRRPEAGGASYVAVCLPAFSPDTVHRDETGKSPSRPRRRADYTCRDVAASAQLLRPAPACASTCSSWRAESWGRRRSGRRAAAERAWARRSRSSGTLHTPLRLPLGTLQLGLVDPGAARPDGMTGRFPILKRLSATAVIPREQGIEGWLWTSLGGSALTVARRSRGCAERGAAVHQAARRGRGRLLRARASPQEIAARSPLGAPAIYGLLSASPTRPRPRPSSASSACCGR